ncbi:MAG: response regulator transcription factor [Lentisphaeria bacterium]|nr:response regulator transcription factor [Lentisphaeria bacterium]
MSRYGTNDGNKKILLINDDASTRELLRLALRSAGFTSVPEAENGETGLVLARRFPPDLILLDLTRPGMDGLTVCRQLKSSPETRSVPILMLSARSGESDIVLGLETGASDYIIKPFSRNILLARIRAQFRLQKPYHPSRVIQFAGLSIDRDERRVSLAGRDLRLSFSEFEILALLASHGDRVFTRGQIIRRVKGEDYPVTDRSVDVQIVNLRRKLGTWGPAHIETVRGVGYRLTRGKTEC